MNSNTARALSSGSPRSTADSASRQGSDHRSADRQAVNLSLVPKKAYPQLVGDAAVLDAMRRTG